MDWLHIALLAGLLVSALASLVLHQRGSKWAAVADAALAGLQELEAGHPALDVAADVAKSGAVAGLFKGLLEAKA